MMSPAWTIGTWSTPPPPGTVSHVSYSRLGRAAFRPAVGSWVAPKGLAKRLPTVRFTSSRALVQSVVVVTCISQTLNRLPSMSTS